MGERKQIGEIKIATVVWARINSALRKFGYYVEVRTDKTNTWTYIPLYDFRDELDSALAKLNFVPKSVIKKYDKTISKYLTYVGGKKL